MLRLLRLKMCLVREDFFLLKSSCPGLSIIYLLDTLYFIILKSRNAYMFCFGDD